MTERTQVNFIKNRRENIGGHRLFGHIIMYYNILEDGEIDRECCNVQTSK